MMSAASITHPSQTHSTALHFTLWKTLQSSLASLEISSCPGVRGQYEVGISPRPLHSEGPGQQLTPAGFIPASGPDRLHLHPHPLTMSRFREIQVSSSSSSRAL